MTDLLEISLDNAIWLGERDLELIGSNFGLEAGVVISTLMIYTSNPSCG